MLPGAIIQEFPPPHVACTLCCQPTTFGHDSERPNDFLAKKLQ